ncbi:uncharacterized protein BCR38DRAFT_177777 [Pseudomassariella vexata]|uniref:ADP-ribosylation factor n=1 Tax=Pseudomassariella vexata TaxID=1141098 RepID=A0A1Y2E4Y0_9PEZI|nr:uncharacterized protein BCR38DRAFT_177777 [Pseudomassariella vexata]ORY66346.1 hypothetical protein BCR38DRAFT_177777 [Pseudomassariella vexata]
MASQGHYQPTAQAGDRLRFDDFDDPEVFQRAECEAAADGRKNFVVEFGPHHARIAHDYSLTEFKQLLYTPQDADHPVRWINIWDTTAQKEAVKAIGDKYNFSYRLKCLMMYATDLKDGAQRSTESRAAAARKLAATQIVEMETDIEKAPGADTTRSLETDTGIPLEEVELYFLVKDTLSYSSIDHTDKALCIGANWLHRRPEMSLPPSEADLRLMPPKHWMWLAICDDNTVLSFHETPTVEPTPKGLNIAEWRASYIRNMRSNTLNVLLQQSSQGIHKYERRPLSQSSIRVALERMARPRASRLPSDMTFNGNGQLLTVGEEGASNLFYYLFEDYAAAGPLKAVGKILDDLTPKVLGSAVCRQLGSDHGVDGLANEIQSRKSKSKSIDIIPKLHHLSKELRKLKHLFENYRILIDKIMAPARSDSSSFFHPARRSIGTRMNSTVSDFQEDGDENANAEARAVVLTKSAMNRFDRLRDRLQGVMLNTIEGYFEEINALSNTYFNLTQQKDSQATARLTRSATLLAKLSVFFLPISFMTSYFSIQIEDLYQWWTAGTYWYAFAVIATGSFLCLFFFGRLLMFFSDVLDEWSAAIIDWVRTVLIKMGLQLEAKDVDDYM